ILPDGGLMLSTHGYAANLAHGVLLAVDQPEASAGQIYNCGDEQTFTLHQWVEIIAQAMNYQLAIIYLPTNVTFPARPIALQATPHHRVMDMSKIKSELGYRDLISTEKALAKTTHWYLEHSPERGGEIEQRLQDPFNYVAEDQLVAVFKESLQRMAAIPFDIEINRPHPYAHPKARGQHGDHRDR